MRYFLQVFKTNVDFEENSSIADEINNFDFRTLIDKLLLTLKDVSDLDAEMLWEFVVSS